MILLVPIGFAIFLLYMYYHGPSPTKSCRWRMNRAYDRDGESYFFCPLCGAERFTADGEPPRLCTRDQPDRG